MLVMSSIAAYCSDIKGKIINDKKEPVEFVNISALSIKDSSFVSGTATDSLGKFSMVVPDTLKYFLKISCVGYDTKYTTNSNDGVITIKQSSNFIDGVTVTAPIPYPKLTAGGLLMAVEGTALAQLGSAEDVLNHIPTLMKVGEGWTVFGKGTPIFYLNNRLLFNMTELENLRSEEIKSVEVIRNPGARYAASVNAVVRIRTVKRKGEGFSVNARSTYSRFKEDSFSEQLDVNYRHNMFNVFATYNYRNKKSIQDATFTQTVYGDTLWRQENVDYDKHKTEWHYLSGGFSYDWGKDNSVGARYSATITGDQHSAGAIDTKVYANNNLYDNLSTTSFDKSFDAPIHEIDAYYNGKLWNTEISFNTDAYFSDDKKTSETTENSEEYDSRELYSTGKSKSRVLATKLILETPLLKGKLTYGAEYSITRRHDTYTINRTDIVSDAYSKIREQTVAPFIEYSHEIGAKSSLTAGLRYEDVRFRYYEDGVFMPDQSRTYKNFFPNIFFNTQVGKTNWQLSYTATTQRPSYSMLSNNVSYSNRFTRQSGNPLLTHQTTHLFSLSGVWKFLNLVVQYKDTRHAFIYWAEQMPNEEGVTVIRYRNIESLKDLTIFASACPTIGVWSPQINAGMIKPWLKLKTKISEYNLNKPIFTFSFNNMFKFSKGWNCNLDFSYQSKGNMQNAKILKENFVLNAGINKTFFNEALTISVKGYDLLYKSWDTGIIYSDNMTFQQICRRGTRQLSIEVKYKFNVTRSKYRGTGAGDSEKNRL